MWPGRNAARRRSSSGARPVKWVAGVGICRGTMRAVPRTGTSGASGQSTFGRSALSRATNSASRSRWPIASHSPRASAGSVSWGSASAFRSKTKHNVRSWSSV